MTRLTPTRLALTLLAATILARPLAAEGLPPIAHTFGNGATLTFYGQINKGVLQYDDGAETQSYGLIDNANSNTRVGLTLQQDWGGGWTFENVDEFSYAPFSTSNTSIEQQSPPPGAWDFTNANIRKIDFTLAHQTYGKVWLGQGSMATDGVQEIDLSKTNVIAYSSVADTAAGQLLRLTDGTLSDIKLGTAFTNTDGPRRVRVRYDTRAFANFTAAAAFGRDLLSDDAETRKQNIADASLTYDNEFGDIALKAGLGYYWQDNDGSSFGGSASALHAPTGLNLTLAAGRNDPDEGDGGRYWYGKLGILRPDLLPWGYTAASVDAYSGDDFALDTDAGITSSSSQSWGLALVQKIDRANTELWLTWRRYDYADNAASYDDGQAIFGGARFKF